MRQFIKIIVLIMIASPIVGFLITSCSEEDNCGIGRPMLWTTFFMPREEGSNDWMGVNLDSVIISIYTDEALTDTIYNGKNIEYVSLPLEYTADSTKMVVEFTKDIQDTLIIRYTNTPYFVSVECGFEMKQSVTEITHTEHAIDSINIKNKDTSRNATDNLRFYITLPD